MENKSLLRSEDGGRKLARDEGWGRLVREGRAERVVEVVVGISLGGQQEQGTPGRQGGLAAPSQPGGRLRGDK